MQLPIYTIHEADDGADAVNTRQWDIRTHEGEEFRVQLAWPLGWETPAEQGASVPVMSVIR